MQNFKKLNLNSKYIRFYLEEGEKIEAVAGRNLKVSFCHSKPHIAIINFGIRNCQFVIRKIKLLI